MGESTFNLQHLTHLAPQQLDQLRTTRERLHHVVDLSQGTIETAVLSRPITPARRRQLLTRFGQAFDTSIFGGPAYRLSARHPYQESPLAWLSASNATSFVPEADEIAFSQALNPGSNRGFMQFHFDVSPDRRSVASISLSAFAWSGATGHITLRAAQSATSVSIPITHQPFNHSIDIVFVPLGGRESDVIMILEPGIQVLAFFSMSFYPEPPVIVANV